MQIGRIEGATRVLGKSQGYNGLPVRDELINEKVNGEGTPSMVTAWEPTPEELQRIIKGANVHVHILGREHPPLMVEVGKAPDMIEVEVLRKTAEALGFALVPKDRVKRVMASVAIRKYDGVPREMVREQLIRQIGRDIAAKLFEFDKVTVVERDFEDFPGESVASVTLDVIVPK